MYIFLYLAFALGSLHWGCADIGKPMEEDLNMIFDMMHITGYPNIGSEGNGIGGNAFNADRCMDKVRCFMTEWDFMREFSTELTNTDQSLFWIEEPPSEWWMNAENKNVNYSVSLNCRAQSYNYDSEVFYEWRKSTTGGQELQIDEMDPRISIMSGRLDINQPRRADAGVYRCFARNRFGTIVSRETRLRAGTTPVKRNRKTVAQMRIQLETSETQIIMCENERTPPAGFPGLEFMWKRIYTGPGNVQREEYITERSHTLKFIDPRKGDLYFLQPTPSDTGIYTCLFRNSFERIQQDGAFDWVVTNSIDITFTSGYPSDKEPNIINRESSIEVQRRLNLTLSCGFQAGASGSSYSMSYSVKWDLPAQRPADAPEPLYLNGGVNLFIESVELTDSGEYRCTVYDDTIDRNYDDHGFQVSVYAVPYLIRQPPPVVALRPGQEIILSCEANAEPAPEYHWFIDGVRQMAARDNSYEITMADTGKMGIYQCEASNEYGSVVGTTTVRVLSMEPLFEYQLQPAVDVTVVSGQGETVLITCKPFSLSAPVFQWTRDNQIIRNSTGIFPKYTSFPNGTLVITNVQQDDAGNYICKATSGGSRDNTYKLTVLPPLSLLSSSGSGGDRPKYTVLLNRTVNLECRLRSESETDGVFVWYLYDRLLTVTSAAERKNADRYLAKLDDIFGSDDIQYILKRDHDIDLYNPPPYFYPENPGNPYYPQNGWSAPTGQSSSGSGSFSNSIFSASNEQFMRNDVLRKAEQYDAFNPYITSEQYQQELRDRHFVTLRYYGTDIPWYVTQHQTTDPLSAHYIRLENDSSLIGDLQVYRAQTWQQGDYKCCYLTAVSSQCTTMSLTVLGVPGRPGNVQFSVGDFILRWGVGGDGNSPIISFIIQAAITPSAQITPDSFVQQQTMELGDVPDDYKRDHEEYVFVKEVQGMTTHVSLWSVVKRYCQYRFRVIARNDVGDSIPSAPSPLYSTPAGLPITKVENITQYFGSPGDLAFQWAKVDDTDFGAPFELSFVITYIPQFSASSTGRGANTIEVKNAPFLHRLTIPAANLSGSITRPSDRKAYSVSVQIKNQYGLGPMSERTTIYTLPSPPQSAVTNLRVIRDSGSSVRVAFMGIDLNRFPDDTFQGYIIEFWRHDVEEFDETQRMYELSPGNRTQDRQENAYVFDLQPSMNYKFVVYPYNLAGRGPASRQVFGETYHQAPSEAPSQVDVYSYSSSAVRVRWSPIQQKSGDSNFEGYKIFYRQFGLPDNETEEYDWRRRDQDETEVVVYGLKGGERYILEVQPYSRGGFGNRSQPVIFLMRYTKFNQLWQDSAEVYKCSRVMIILLILVSLCNWSIFQ